MAYDPFKDVSVRDGANLDSFSRLRTSSPTIVFDAQFTYNLQPLLFAAITAESGAVVAHDTTNRLAAISFSSTPTGGKAYMQSYEYFRYQPGRSQLVFITFNMLEAVADVVKFAGYSDGSNGIEFRLNGTTKELVLFSDTTTGDQTKAQADWNLDKLDGTGASGLTLNISKTQILVIDFQALYVGRVRVGFDIGGEIVYVHEFLCANTDAYPYAQSMNLPVRCGMTTTAASASTAMRFICSAVISEGGEIDLGGIGFSVEGAGTAGNNTPVHILSVQPLGTFNSITNRTKFILESIELYVSGNTPVKYDLVIGQDISGTVTFNPVNSTHSAFEANSAGTLSGAATLTIASGYCTSGASVKSSINRTVNVRTPITLDYLGAARLNGRLSLLVTGLGATSACRAVFNWREVR